MKSFEIEDMDHVLLMGMLKAEIARFDLYGNRTMKQAMSRVLDSLEKSSEPVPDEFEWNAPDLR